MSTLDLLVELVVLWTVVLVPTGCVFYYGAVLSGMYKDSLMAVFRGYGQERRPNIAFRFLLTVGGWCVVLIVFLNNLIDSRVPVARERVSWLLGVLALLAFGGSVTVRWKPHLSEALPRWYHILLRTSTRQERRRIANAWLRLPWKLRWRLNGDQAAFRVWADMVRITVIYGAHNPDDPWDTWG